MYTKNEKNTVSRRKKRIYSVTPVDLNVTEVTLDSDRLKVLDALETVIQHGIADGLRDATIRDYTKWMTEYVNYSQIIYADQLNDKVGGGDLMALLKWLDSMSVSPATKRIRLKAVKAVLRRTIERE